MMGFERAVEWLRPFVSTNAWDFCVIWKLGDDPSRFIEWKDCCCKGGINVKVERDEFQGPLCRDSQFQHSIRSKACEALSHFPFAISLYAGIHGEVAISNHSKWVNHTNVSASLSSQEIMGTQVLIPVFGGLVELIASKHIPKDQNMIELIRTECNSFLAATAESYAKANLEKWYLNTLLKKDLSTVKQLIPSVSNSNTRPSLDGSSNGSSPSIEHPPFALGSSYEETAKQPEKVCYRSKNLVVERKRRQRIKDGLLQLRALVPKISKMDISSTLTDAIEYIGNLQDEEKKLHNELWEIEEGDRQKSAKLDWLHRNNQVSTGLSEMGKMEVHVEVNQITKREFLIKLCYEHKRGGFANLMEGMDCLGLGVIDANVTTFNGNMLNIFKVKANKNFQSKELRDLLTNLIN